ncbi:unnamed protein product, partial [Urochloa humidicola]
VCRILLLCSPPPPPYPAPPLRRLILIAARPARSAQRARGRILQRWSGCAGLVGRHRILLLALLIFLLVGAQAGHSSRPGGSGGATAAQESSVVELPDLGDPGAPAAVRSQHPHAMDPHHAPILPAVCWQRLGPGTKARGRVPVELVMDGPLPASIWTAMVQPCRYFARHRAIKRPCWQMQRSCIGRLCSPGKPHNNLISQQSRLQPTNHNELTQMAISGYMANINHLITMLFAGFCMDFCIHVDLSTDLFLSEVCHYDARGSCI